MFANMVRSQITTFNDVLHEIQSALSKYQYNVCYLCNWDIWVIKKTFSNPYHTNIALASFSRLSMDWFKGKFTELILHSSTISGWRFGTWILFFHILGIIIPTDELIFFRGVGQPPTRFFLHGFLQFVPWTNPLKLFSQHLFLECSRPIPAIFVFIHRFLVELFENMVTPIFLQVRSSLSLYFLMAMRVKPPVLNHPAASKILLTDGQPIMGIKNMSCSQRNGHFEWVNPNFQTHRIAIFMGKTRWWSLGRNFSGIVSPSFFPSVLQEWPPIFLLWINPQLGAHGARWINPLATPWRRSSLRAIQRWCPRRRPGGSSFWVEG